MKHSLLIHAKTVQVRNLVTQSKFVYKILNLSPSVTIYHICRMIKLPPHLINMFTISCQISTARVQLSAVKSKIIKSEKRAVLNSFFYKIYKPE